MSIPKTILVPIDGSDQSERAAHYALKIARLMNAKILLLHCHNSFPMTLGEPYYQKALNKIMESANDLLDNYLKLLSNKDVEIDIRSVEGSPGSKISKVAEIEKCEMIVMGSRGLSDLKGLFIGSVTHQVLHTTTCPVLVVR